MNGTFRDFVLRATGGAHGPYDYQRRLAEEGLPDLLGVPTGSGKTLAAVLPWLWRLREVRASGAAGLHRLVYVLPMRALVEQTAGEIGGWLDRLGLAGEVQFQVLMGGADRGDGWQLDPVPLENRILAVTWAFSVSRRPARTR